MDESTDKKLHKYRRSRGVFYEKFCIKIQSGKFGETNKSKNRLKISKKSHIDYFPNMKEKFLCLFYFVL